MDRISNEEAAEILGIIYNSSINEVGKIPINIIKMIEEKALYCEERNFISNKISIGRYNFSQKTLRIIFELNKKYNVKLNVDRLCKL